MSAAPLFVAGEDDAPARRRPDGGRPRRLASVSDADRPGDAARPLRVLLVEDDPAMRLVCRVNLESDGFQVVTAGSGKEALGLAAAERPDLVLLDVMLPDLGGFQVAARLHGVPVVFLSARGSKRDLEQGRLAGAIDYVTKPFDPVDLAFRVREDLAALARTGDATSVWEMRFGPPPEAGE